MPVKFKDNVHGFVYDSQFGEVKKVLGWKLNEGEIKALESRKGVLCEALGMESEYDCLFTNIDSVNELFVFESEDSLNCDSEGLNKVLDWIN
jgi:hypothetical protein